MYRIFNYFNLNKVKLFSVFFLVVLFASYIRLFAVGLPYNPGDTLDPNCAPGDVDCTVEFTTTETDPITGAINGLIKSDGLGNISAVTSGTDVKTINGSSILGSGDILVSSSPWLINNLDTYYEGGNVGIGTSTPINNLDIYGSTVGLGLNTLSDTGYGSAIYFQRQGSTKWYQQVDSLNEGTDQLDFDNASGVAVLSLLQNGNIGIGTSNPNYLLNIYKSQNSGTAFEISNDNSGTNAFVTYNLAAYTTGGSPSANKLYVYQFGENYSGSSVRYASASSVLDGTGLNGLRLSGSNPTTGNISFWTGGDNERMRIITNGNVGFGNTTPLAKLHIGNNNVNNSVDSQVLISRLVDNSLSGNGHAFSDSSNVSRSGTIGYNSFDSRISITGTNNFDHYAAFQTAPVYSSSGIMTNYYGLFSTATVSSGTITNSYGAYIANPTGAGTISNNYGVYVQSLTKGATTNYGIYTAGTMPNYFGGNVGVGQAVPTAKIHLAAGTATANTSPLKFTSGTLLTTSEAGSLEFNGSHLYFTITNGGARYQLDQQSAGSMVYPGSGIPSSTGSSWGSSYSTTGSGSVIALSTSPTFSTNIFTPYVVGGTTATSDLYLKTTSGVGTTGADMHFLVGSNGGTEALTILNNGYVGVGVTNPLYKVDVSGGISASSLNINPTDINHSVVLSSSGSIGIRTNPEQALDVNGNSVFRSYLVLKDGTNLVGYLGDSASIYLSNIDNSVGLLSDNGVLLGGSFIGPSMVLIDHKVGIERFTPTSRLDINAGLIPSPYQTFSGSGLNDAVYSGEYTGVYKNVAFHVMITDVGGVDTFTYYDLFTEGFVTDYGGCVGSAVITGSPQLLCDGIYITFTSTTGHTLNDDWIYNTNGPAYRIVNPVIKVSDELNSSNYFLVNAVASDSLFLGQDTGANAISANYSNFLGHQAGYNALYASNSIFIGQQAGYNDSVVNTSNSNDFSILIGKSTSTGGFKNSIAIGGSSTNTSSNQFMIGSSTRPINTTIWKGSASTECTLTTGTGVACTSDERLKDNITDLSGDTLDKLIKVRTVNFNWLNSENDFNNIGFIAQDLEQYFPEIVATDSQGYKSVYYSNMTPILTEAIRELDLKIKALTPITISYDNSFVSIFNNFLIDQLVVIRELKTSILRVDGDVCVDDVCISKEEFKSMLLEHKQIPTDNSSENTEDITDESNVIEDDTDTSTEEVNIPTNENIQESSDLLGDSGGDEGEVNISIE